MKKHTLESYHEKNIEIVNDLTLDNNINEELKKKLFETKCFIDNLDGKKWEISKKKENIYEYVYTSSKKEKNVCDIVPVSRSYFKIHEIMVKFNIYDNELSCACIAEGPGGFIHCLNDNKSSKVVKEVIIVLDKVSLIERLAVSLIFIFVYLLKFSLIRSYITTVSFIEYPTIVKTAAIIERLISNDKIENIPIVIITS